MSAPPPEPPAEPRPLRTIGEVPLITGEAVLIDIPPAPLPHRLVSGVIDLIAYLLLLFGCIWFVAVQLLSLSGAAAAAMVLVLVVGCTLVAPLTIETLTRGRSLGKAIMSLRTVRDDGGPIVFRHAFVRALLGVIEIFAFSGGPAVVAALCTVRVKRLGDLAAGTYVVRVQRLRPLTAPPAMPMPLAGWAQACDISPLPDGLALSVREFLLRAHQLTPQARADLSTRLMAQIGARVSPPPPAGAPPEMVLAAVLGEQRRRQTLRLEADHQVRARLLPPDPLAASGGEQRERQG